MPNLTAKEWMRLEKRGWPSGRRQLSARGDRGTTPLMEAVCGPALHAVIRELLSFGIDVNATDMSGKTAAFYTSDKHILQTLVDNGLNLDLPNNDGNTVLDDLGFWVFEYGDYEGKADLVQMKDLVDLGAGIDHEGGNGDSFRSLVMERGHTITGDFPDGENALRALLSSIEQRDLEQTLPQGKISPKVRL